MILRISLILIIIGIGYLSLTPSDTISIGNDKIGHFVAYAILMINVGLITFEKKAQFTIGIISCLVYGALMEIGQHFVPGRSMSSLDMLANTGGVIVGVLIIIIFYKQFKKLLKATRII
jgi:VanZ family protein